MTPFPRSSAPSRRRRFRRILGWSLLASLLLHGALLLLWRAPGPGGAGEAASAVPRPPRPREEWSGIRAVTVRRAPAAEAARRSEAEVRRSAVLPEPRVRPARHSRLALETVRPGAAAVPRVGEGAASPEGTGEPGSRGSGGSGGPAGGASPPVPRTLVPEWDPPGEVRGTRVTVRVEVDVRGDPTGEVVLDPPTPSESFNRRLRRRMASLEFLPARRDGQPVRGWAEITFVF